MANSKTVVSQRKRNRGVRASRKRLLHALAQAGFTSQSALAEHMADIEALPAAPRHLVNRVFREQPVDPLSLERVATALGVAAHTLYLTKADDADIDAITRDPAPSGSQALAVASKSRRRVWPHLFARFAIVGIAGIAVTATLIWSVFGDKPLACDLREWLLPPHADSGRLGVLVARFDNDPENFGQLYLAKALRSDPVLARRVSVLTTCRVYTLPAHKAGTLRSDRIAAVGSALLRDTGTEVLLWGRLEDERIQVRFASGRRHHAVAAGPSSETPPGSPDDALEIALALDEPHISLSRIKVAALGMMNPRDPTLRQLRSTLIGEYALDKTRKPARAQPVAAHAVAH